METTPEVALQIVKTYSLPTSDYEMFCGTWRLWRISADQGEDAKVQLWQRYGKIMANNWQKRGKKMAKKWQYFADDK